MAQLQSDTAVIYANMVIGLVQQIRGMRSQVAEIVAINANTPLSANFWNVLKTTALAADGTLGTADGSVVAGDPIDTRVYPALLRAVKQGDLSNALGILVDFNTFCNGTQVNANASRPGQINNVAM